METSWGKVVEESLDLRVLRVLVGMEILKGVMAAIVGCRLLDGREIECLDVLKKIEGLDIRCDCGLARWNCVFEREYDGLYTLRPRRCHHLAQCLLIFISTVPVLR